MGSSMVHVLWCRPNCAKASVVQQDFKSSAHDGVAFTQHMSIVLVETACMLHLVAVQTSTPAHSDR